MLGIYVTVPVACFRKGLAREYLETEAIPPPSTCYGFLLSLVGETERKQHTGCRVSPTLLRRPEQSVVLRTVWRVKTRNAWKGPNGTLHLLSDTEQKRFRKWTVPEVAEAVKGLPEAEVARELGRLSWGELLNRWINSGRPSSADSVKVSRTMKKQIESWSAKNSQLVPLMGSGENARPDYQQLLTNVRLIIWLDSSEETGARSIEDRVRTALTEPEEVGRFGGLSLGESTHLVNEVSLIDSRHTQRFSSDGAEAYLLHPEGRLTLPVWVDHVGSAGTRYVTGNLISCDLAPPPRELMPKIEPP